jgi:crotonobetainyl-CoA:carnitine CoA-transferase CaiB-like acyl-CoA transferase
MDEPLSGITVVEMTIAVQGPAAGLYLRDMGADVIKVEPPLGDASRYGRGRDNETPAGTVGPQYVACNRGKRSVCIDLATELGMRAVQGLLATADVFLTNYREPALQKMGLGYEALHARYPTLIYASVNGFGPKGPDADKAMLDGAAVARGGLVNMTGPADQSPSVPGAIVGDTAGAMHLALGAMTALFARERNGGIGQRVQTSALGTQLWLQQWELTHVAMTGANLTRDGNHHSIIKGPYGAYRTKDGGAIMLTQTMQSDGWDAFCIFGDVPELAFDPRLKTPGQRLGEGLSEQDSIEIRTRIEFAFAQRTTQEWDDFLRTQPEIIWERVRDWHEVLEDEQSILNEYITTVDVPGLGPQKTVGNLVNLSETPGSVKGNAPELGEANVEKLTAAGLSLEEIEEATAQAAVVREEAFALLLPPSK